MGAVSDEDFPPLLCTMTFLLDLLDHLWLSTCSANLPILLSPNLHQLELKAVCMMDSDEGSEPHQRLVALQL